MAKNLLIVESPAKAKTINNYLGKDFVVKSSFGHIRDLSKKNLGVDVEGDFKPQYEISADKKKIVAELKKLSKEAETVWLASDEDREGEAIAWHLAETLKLKEDKTKRIVFHEITKNAITNAIENPRLIDYNLVNAQQARRVLDRLVGFELSPLLWKKVKPSLSAGRVQSVAVRLIVEREQEIADFKPTFSYRVVGEFKNDKGIKFNSSLSKKFGTKESALEFLESCKSYDFSVGSIETTLGKRSPAAPFTTSSLQQEANRKLGFSVSKTMMLAQRLYEAGHITYMRTDSLNLSDLAINIAKEEIVSAYGKEYSKTRKFVTKTKGAQEAHEAIRPTNMSARVAGSDAQQKKLYDLILKRTLASQMSDAKLEKTTITINTPKKDYNFVTQGEVIIFDGFLKVYEVSKDEEDDNQAFIGSLPKVNIGEQLIANKIIANQVFTKYPPRYSEAALVKKMEELGIGRPSTYAPTISTIINREYVVKDEIEGFTREVLEITLSGKNIKEVKKNERTGASKGRLSPTDIGKLVNDFLIKYFEEIIAYGFTAGVEKEFDLIAEGKLEWNKIIKEFYHDFHNKVEEVTETAERFSGERLLGVDPESGKNLYVRIGRFGAIAQIGEASDEEKPRFAGLQKGQNIADITFKEALSLFKFPRRLGEYEGKVVTVAIGRFGPYVRHNNKFFSLGKEDQPGSIEFDRAIELIEAKRQKDRENTIKTFEEQPELIIMNGRFGPYISFEKKNYKIAKGTDPNSLSLEDCMEIIEKTPVKKKATRKKAAPKKTPTKKKAVAKKPKA
jgi:DNA topoisomerase-1